jgi:hypothetical protein
MKQKSTYKIIIAWMLLLLYLINPFRVYQPYLNYQVNYQYISTVLCENKEKPKLECNGKCHLTKELKKSAEEESKNKTNVPRNFQLEDFTADELTKTTIPFYLIVERKYSSFISSIYSSYLNKFSPPPKA